MSNLLQVTRFQSQAMQKKGVRPLLLEFQVSPESAPYLVTSTQGVLWVEEPFPGNVIRSAVREMGAPGALFTEMVQAVATRGVDDAWGNVFPYTQSGLESAMAYLESYGLDDVEVLVPTKSAPTRPEWMKTAKCGHHVRPASWVPEGWAIVVPIDKGFVGMLGHLSPKHVVAAVHNASRGIAILQEG